MPAASHLSTSGVIEEWPTGLTQALPAEHWLVVHAFPRQDKRLIEDLRRRQFPLCAFFERRIRVYPGKGKQTSLVPLLGGYVFVAVEPTAKPAIYETGRVVRIIDVRQPQKLAADLTSLCALVTASTAPLMVRPHLVAGKRVVLQRGTFSGCSGVVIKRQNQVELIVNLELLGHSVSVTLPAEFAELAEG